MLRKIEAARRHYSDFDWLQTYWLFSFAEYYDPENLQFGALRVFNDDIVLPGTGFPTHPHREMEIITIPLDGEITHADSMGNRALIRSGDVQRMSAGTGLTHSEFNLGTRPVHFYQIWIFPDQRGLPPTYEQRHDEPENWHNRLYPVASGQGLPNVVTFHTDATIYRAALESGVRVPFAVAGDRRVFVYVTAGAVAVNGQALAAGDQARLDEAAEVELRALSATELILIDLPSCKGYGYERQTLKGARAR